MGARLAVGIMSATRELERMCSEDDSPCDADAEGDADVDGSPYGGILDENMLEDAVGEDDDEDDIDAEGVDDDDIFGEDEPLQIKPLGRLIVPAPLPASALSPALERVASEDVPMPDAPVMSASWIVVGETPREDWEMVEGA
jgi:hypothetical protein